MARKDLKVGRMNLLVQCVRNLPCVKECSNYGILKVLLTDTDLFFFGGVHETINQKHCMFQLEIVYQMK